MVITSVSEKPVITRYGNTQLRYAMTYVFITFFVLLILNIYCAKTSQKLFYQSKEASMVEKCQLAADEIAKLEVLNSSTISTAVSRLDSLKATRLIVTDQAGKTLYDSAGTDTGTYALLPEILQALDNSIHRYGNDAFSWQYHNGAMESRAATTILYYGSIIGCVYMTEYDTAQGALIQNLLDTILQITLILELLVLLFSLVFSHTFSRRMNKIMASMRIIQKGDYTHKVEMGGNDELTVLGNEFNHLTERLHTSEQKRRRFVSDASHELKTPLASIKLLTDSVLQNEMDADTIREFVQDIGNEADRLTRMTAKLLSLTVVDGQPAADCEIIRSAPTVRRVVKMLSSIAAQNGITVEMEVIEDSPILILEDDLYQVIFNLVENGIKYNTPGGKVTVTLSRQKDNAVLHIRDTGVGIPEDSIGHIFERFYRVDKARSRSTGGTGLGLSIVRAIVERNRGELQVSSRLGEGTVFTLSFPAFDTEVDSE